MKMNYHLKNKPKLKYSWKVISVVFLFFLLSSLLHLFPNVMRDIGFTFAKPLWIASGAVKKTSAKISNLFVFKSTLISKNLSLEDELSILRLKEIDYNVLSKENQDLKNQLGRKDNVHRIISYVLSKPPNSPYDIFVIDVGSSDGVNLGNKVYLSDNVIIGLISSVTAYTSLVELLSSGNKKQEVILSRTGASFTLLGRGGGNLELEVPKDTDILWGDAFMYPNISPSLVGTVYYIDTNSQSSFKKIYLRVPGNVFSTKYVFIE